MEILFQGERVDNGELVKGFYRPSTFYNMAESFPTKLYTKHFIGCVDNISIFDGLFEQVEVKEESVKLIKYLL